MIMEIYSIRKLGREVSGGGRGRPPEDRRLPPEVLMAAPSVWSHVEMDGNREVLRSVSSEPWSV